MIARSSKDVASSSVSESATIFAAAAAKAPRDGVGARGVSASDEQGSMTYAQSRVSQPAWKRARAPNRRRASPASSASARGAHVFESSSQAQRTSAQVLVPPSTKLVASVRTPAQRPWTGAQSISRSSGSRSAKADHAESPAPQVSWTAPHLKRAASARTACWRASSQGGSVTKSLADDESSHSESGSSKTFLPAAPSWSLAIGAPK